MVEEDKIYVAKDATWESFVRYYKNLDVYIVNSKGSVWIIKFDYQGDADIQKGDKITVLSDIKPIYDGTWYKAKATNIELVARNDE